MLFLSFFQYAPESWVSLNAFSRLGVGQMRADAHIHIFALLKEAQHGVVGQITDVLHLVGLTPLFHQLIASGSRLRTNGFIGRFSLTILRHFRLDGRQVLIGELVVAKTTS